MNTVPLRSPRRVWPWLLGAAVAFMVLALAGGAALVSMLGDAVHGGLHMNIDGEEFNVSGFSPIEGMLLFAGIALAVLLVVTAVPLIVGLSLLLGLGAAALGLGAALVAVLLAVAAVSSPLWLAALVLWLVLRRRRPARMPA